MAEPRRRWRQVCRQSYAAAVLGLTYRSAADTAERAGQRQGRRYVWGRDEWPGSVALFSVDWLQRKIAADGAVIDVDPVEVMYVQVPVTATEDFDDPAPNHRAVTSLVSSSPGDGTVEARIVREAVELQRAAEVEAAEERLARYAIELRAAEARADAAEAAASELRLELERARAALHHLTAPRT